VHGGDHGESPLSSIGLPSKAASFFLNVDHQQRLVQATLEVVAFTG